MYVVYWVFVSCVEFMYRVCSLWSLCALYLLACSEICQKRVRSLLSYSPDLVFRALTNPVYLLSPASTKQFCPTPVQRGDWTTVNPTINIPVEPSKPLHLLRQNFTKIRSADCVFKQHRRGDDARLISTDSDRRVWLIKRSHWSNQNKQLWLARSSLARGARHILITRVWKLPRAIPLGTSSQSKQHGSARQESAGSGPHRRRTPEVG